MSETYGISTYGKEYLVDEGLKELPPLRIIFITINVLLSIGPLAYLASRYWSLRKGLKAISRRRQAANALQLLTSSFVAFMVNNTLRSLHMVDHICRPVYYHEPRWAYEKIWITEMEVPTYANFLMAIIALQGLGQLFRVVAQGDRSGLPVALSVMGLYVVGSLFNLVHYTIEPPSNYGPFANFNIAGTAITNLPIVYFLVKAYLYIPEGKGDQLLSSEAVEGSGTRASSRKRAPVNRLSY